MADEPVRDCEPVPNEGLGIFGDVATTEVPDDDAPARDFERPPGPEPTRVIPIGAAWNQPIASPPVASDEAEERKPNPFGRMRGIRRAAQPADDEHSRG